MNYNSGGTDPYNCAWDPLTEWDVEPNQWLVRHRDPMITELLKAFMKLTTILPCQLLWGCDQFWYPIGNPDRTEAMV